MTTSTPALQIAGTTPAKPRYRSFGDCVLTLADDGAELDVDVEETDEGEVIVHVYGEESELRRIVGRCSNYDRPGESVSSCMLDSAWGIDGSIEVEEVFPDGEGGYEVTLSGFESGVAAILEECDREE